jgi:hypothetical protein
VSWEWPRAQIIKDDLMTIIWRSEGGWEGVSVGHVMESD